MIDHLGINTTDFARSKEFYDAVFAALGGSLLMTVPAEFTGGKQLVGYGRDRPVFWVQESDTALGQHIALTARSRTEVEAFHAAALHSGGRDNGGPGLRPHYQADYYAAFAFDPDGNNIEAVTHAPE